jgi:hypothetical protein
MAKRYTDRIRQHCERCGIEIPIGFGRHPASRYAIIDLGPPAKLVARTWFTVEDLIYYLDRAADVPRQILDFKREVVLERDGKRTTRVKGPIESV